MKAEVNEQDVVKHWGIWVFGAEAWLVDDSGIIFAVTCPRVANAQHEMLISGLGFASDSVEVREIV